MTRAIFAVRAFVLTLAVVASAAVRADDASVPPLHSTVATPNAGAYSWEYGPFQYDPAGNVAVIGSDYFVYDPIGRLVKSTTPAPDHSGSMPRTYEYDVYGNQTKVDSTSYAASADTNRLTSASYDTAGNLISWVPPGSVAARQYTYDSLNMMTGQATVNQSVPDHIENYVYTADDERLWSIEGAASSNWAPVSHWTLRDLGGKVLRDFIDDGTDSSPDWHLFREYVYRDGLLLATNTESGTEHYSLDHLGTPRLITNSSRNVVYAHQYFPYGSEWNLGGPSDGSTLRFTGHERDDDLRGEAAGTLDYMHARFYANNPGRFLSVDLLIGSPGFPQSWNRYNYVANDPIGSVDPDGRCAFTVNGNSYSDSSIFCMEVTATSLWSTAAGHSAAENSALRDAEFARDSESVLDTRNPFTGMTVREHWQANTEGLMAFVDGVIPWADPLKDNYKDSSIDGLDYSQKVGEYTRDTEISIILSHLATAGVARGGWLNSNRYLRMGFSRKGGNRVFRIGGKVIEWFTKSGKIDIWKGPRL